MLKMRLTAETPALQLVISGTPILTTAYASALEAFPDLLIR